LRTRPARFGSLPAVQITARAPQAKEAKMLSNQRSLRVVAALAVTVALAGPIASAGAAGREPGSRSENESSFSVSLGSLWSWVKSALGPVAVTRADCDRGAGLDPNGRCTAAPGGPNGG
jgi:hypothetical protein